MGDALIRYQAELEKALGDRIHFLPEQTPCPSAATLVRWFQSRDDRLMLLQNPRDLVPLYFRPSGAEEKIRI